MHCVEEFYHLAGAKVRGKKRFLNDSAEIAMLHNSTVSRPPPSITIFVRLKSGEAIHL